MAYCERCGHELSDRAYACPQCGHPRVPPVEIQFGAPTGPGGRPLADWWQRLLAIVIDSAIVTFASFVALRAFGAFVGADLLVVVSEGERLRLVGEPWAKAAFFGVVASTGLGGILYYSLLNGSRRGQTIGKRALGIRVRDEETGEAIGYARAFLRWLVYALAFVACGLPGILNVLWPLWDPKRQSWHDKAARSIVVKDPRPAPEAR